MVLYGKKALLDNIKNVYKVDVSNARKDIINLLKKTKIDFSIQPEAFFNQFPTNLNHQGIISYTKHKEKYNTLEELLENSKDKSTIVVLDSIMDTGNYGAILRTCNAFGVDAVIVKKNEQAQINEYVVKASQGAIENLNIFKVTNLSQTLELLKKHGYWTYATGLNDKAKDYSKIKYDEKTVVIFGNEDKGVSKNVLDNADFVVKIPMTGTVQSLNVSVSVGIVLAKVRE
ncbi:MAG: 23S rRNA (guanosine(2251)-2'-O)-methyltransferase RlmB [Mycoplasmataceae bacterium]|nr:23S rRNA (guanosine(2251)-2'-O)-methyltransferase RlmB [Mycoplasmataceae bacterium]